MFAMTQGEVEIALETRNPDYFLYFADKSLNGLNLSNRTFKNVSFNASNLDYVNMDNSIFHNCVFADCKFNDSSMEKCKFEFTNFRDCKIHVNFSDSVFQHTSFANSFLNMSRFKNADIRGLEFCHCDMCHAFLSGAIVESPKQFMDRLFGRDAKGWIVYKGFNCEYNIPPYWKLESGSFIEEVVNPDRTSDCGCGINFATKQWIKEHYPLCKPRTCRIHFEDACGIVVPYSSTGKARCDRLEILE